MHVQHRLPLLARHLVQHAVPREACHKWRPHQTLREAGGAGGSACTGACLLCTWAARQLVGFARCAHKPTVRHIWQASGRDLLTCTGDQDVQPSKAVHRSSSTRSICATEQLTCAGDQDVQPSKAVHRSSHQLGRQLGVSHVSCHTDSRAAAVADEVCCGLLAHKAWHATYIRRQLT